MSCTLNTLLTFLWSQILHQKKSNSFNVSLSVLSFWPTLLAHKLNIFLMLSRLLTPNHPVTSGLDCMCNYLLSGTICLINMSEHLLLSLLKQINAVFPQPWGIINREKKGSYKNTQKLIQWGRSSQHAARQGPLPGPLCLPERLLSSSLLWQGNRGSPQRLRFKVGFHVNFKKEWDDACLEKKNNNKPTNQKTHNKVKQQIMILVESLSSLCVICSSRLSGMGPGSKKIKRRQRKKKNQEKQTGQDKKKKKKSLALWHSWAQLLISAL